MRASFANVSFALILATSSIAAPKGCSEELTEWKLAAPVSSASNGNASTTPARANPAPLAVERAEVVKKTIRGLQRNSAPTAPNKAPIGSATSLKAAPILAPAALQKMIPLRSTNTSQPSQTREPSVGFSNRAAARVQLAPAESPESNATGTARTRDANASAAPISLTRADNEFSATDTSGPAINCRVPVQSIGSLNLYDSVAVIRGGIIEITSAYDSGVISPSLRGYVLKSDSPNALASGERQMTGLALFSGGKLLDQLGQRPGEDTIFRNAGAVTGDIISCDGQVLVVMQRDRNRVSIPLATVTYLRSPRAFLFTLTGHTTRVSGSRSYRTQVGGVTFHPTTTGTAAIDAAPTSVVSDKRDEYLEDEPSGFTFTSSTSRYQPAMGNGPVFDNNMPVMPRRPMQAGW